MKTVIGILQMQCNGYAIKVYDHIKEANLQIEMPNILLE